MVTEDAVRAGDRLRFGAVEALVVTDLDEALKDLRDIGSTKEQVGTETVLRDQLRKLRYAQRRVLRWLLRGLAEKQIAFELNLSPHTVHSHVKEIHSVLAVRSRGELMAKFWTIWEEV
jgi:DNA-binding NarL/FixJ family response regulator